MTQITMEEVTCQECKLPAIGQKTPGGPCINCQKVPRSERKAPQLLKMQAQLSSKLFVVLCIIGLFLVGGAGYYGKQQAEAKKPEAHRRAR